MRRILALSGLLSFVTLVLLGSAGPAGAHGFTTVVRVQAVSAGADHVRTTLGLEYDLMVVSVSDTQHDDPFFEEGQPAWDDGDYPRMTRALEDHQASLLAYLAQRFGVEYGGKACTPTLLPSFTVAMDGEQGVPYATLVVDWACPHDADAAVLKQGHVLHSALFPDTEGYIKSAQTIVAYHLDGTSGSAALDANRPSFSTTQSWGTRFWQFYRLGIEHLLTGPDHLLFLTALIIGSRKLREIVFAATTFTLAHSTTLVLAAFGLIQVSSDVVEPLIALSIAATAAWYLWRLWRKGDHATDLDTTSTSHFALDRAGWVRLAVVFCFGLVHGMGFAGALGIDHAWSWALLWSLLVFNLGIETVQLGLIVVIFPALMLLRRAQPRSALWLTGAIGVVVSVAGLLWFLQRLVGWSVIPG